MSKKSFIYLFYGLFILCAVASLVFIPQAITYGAGSQVALILFFLPLAYILWFRFGFLFFLKTILLLSLFALFIEYVGLTTGWPYGTFVYTGSLGYKFFGVLPWTVGISWIPLMLGSVALVYRFTNKSFLRIVLPVCLLVIFDFILDPVAVHLGLWHYVAGGVYYDVPWQNFLGWIFSGLIGSLLCFFLFRKKSPENVFELRHSFFISIIFWTSIALLKMLVIPAVVGLILLTIYLVLKSVHHEKTA